MDIHYGLIAGIVQSDMEQGKHPHLEINIKTQDNTSFRVAVNVKDYDGNAVFFAHIENLNAGFLDFLNKLENRAYNIDTGDVKRGLDYIRGNFLSKEDFQQIQEPTLTPMLMKFLSPYIEATDGSRVFAYGSRFPDGIHDIHMNQGYPNTPSTPYEDGGLILYDASEEDYEGLFFHFHTQSFDS